MAPPLVLVVDAHDDSRAIYTAILQHAGFAVDACSAPDEGLRAARLRPPDVVVLGLPPKRPQAIGALRDFRGEPVTARVPLLALSTVPALDEREVMHAEGTTAYMAKPCPPLALLAEIRRLLTR